MTACEPLSSTDPADGAIAQLGERVVRNDEVGGSIPPGSTIFALGLVETGRLPKQENLIL